MDNFEQKILNAVSEKLNDGTVEKLVQQYIEKSVSRTLEELFSWSGDGKKLIEKKLSEVIVPVIERHEFNQYLIKLDSVLTEIINATVLVDNRKILENFKELMIEPNRREIKLSEIFSRYCKHVAKNIDTKIEIQDVNTNDANELFYIYKSNFDLSIAPLFKVTLFKLPNGKSLIMLNVHHIIFDGTSLNNFINELSKSYNGENLQSLDISYKDFAVWENEALENNIFKESKEYWLKKLQVQCYTFYGYAI